MIDRFYFQSDQAGPRLRIGLLVDGDHVPAFAAAVIEHIRACDFADIVLVVERKDGQSQFAEKLSWLKRAWRVLRTKARRRTFCYALYTRLEEKLARNPQADPLRMVEVGHELAGIPRLVVEPQASGFVHRFPAEAVETVRECKLDVLLRFGFNILKGDVLTAARCGIWSYHHGDPEFYRGAPPQFWEMAEGNPRSGAVLQILDEHLDGGTVLEKGIFSNDLSISVRRNRITVFWGSVHFVIARLKVLHEQGIEHLLAQAYPAVPYRGRRVIYRTPSNGEFLRWFLGTLACKLRHKFGPRQVEHWQIAVRRSGTTFAVQPERGSVDLSGFAFVPSPKGLCYADPFVFWHHGQPYVFFECDSYRGQPAIISVAQIGADGIGPVSPCLALPFHLSFPQVFEAEGEIFMMPESLEAGELALYRAVAFPHHWEKDRVLLQGNVVDAALWQQDGHWYLFATVVDLRSRTSSLHLFFSETLHGPWEPHPENPLSYDVRRARGAGALFQRSGKLFRPSQDGSGSYGRALEFNMVDELSAGHYAEHVALVVTPDHVPRQGKAVATGVHTYHEAGGIEVIDAKFRVPARRVL
ncbi:formyltransferase family protein [Azorhizobium caulinodans]|uniref:glucosamine inositolphosphorylceramide transferase family protein n=1 Tax=Azorhizobium caulinodans TaxID=7 RepID=UPI002FBE2399